MRKTAKEKQQHGRRARGLLSAGEAATILGKSRRTIHRKQLDGEMPARVSVSDGSRLYYRHIDILEMAAAAPKSHPPDGTV